MKSMSSYYKVIRGIKPSPRVLTRMGGGVSMFKNTSYPISWGPCQRKLWWGLC